MIFYCLVFELLKLCEFARHRSPNMADQDREDQNSLKRQHDQVEASPQTPPLTRSKPDPEAKAFTDKFLNMLSDGRIVDALTKILLQPVLTRLNEKYAKIQTLTDQASSLEDQVTDLKNDITSLKNSYDLEQYGRRNSLRICMSDPETQGENTDELVLKYAEKASVTLTAGEICRSHRVGRHPSAKTRNACQVKPRHIIVKFNTYNSRQKIFNARKNAEGVFVGEDLTRSTLFYKARQERAASRFLHCWSSDGNIKIRLHNKTVLTVTNQAQLEQLIQDTPTQK